MLLPHNLHEEGDYEPDAKESLDQHKQVSVASSEQSKQASTYEGFKPITAGGIKEEEMVIP